MSNKKRPPSGLFLSAADEPVRLGAEDQVIYIAQRLASYDLTENGHSHHVTSFLFVLFEWGNPYHSMHVCVQHVSKNAAHRNFSVHRIGVCGIYPSQRTDFPVARVRFISRSR